MPRPRGATNVDYAESRARLVQALWPVLLQPGGARLSFRELARAAGVSPATLRHYFGTRDGVLKAAIEALHQAGLRFLAEAASAEKGDVRSSLRWLLDSIVDGWRRGVGAAHTLGLSAGLGDAVLGPAYVTDMLEPTLQSAEARLARHVAQGELGRCDLRHAALELLAAPLLALLHQQNLFGAKCRALDLDAFVSDHLDRFLRAHAPPAPERSRGTRRPS